MLGVIDAHLTKTGRPYLVGDKVSFVDLMFVPWNNVLATFLMDESFRAEFPEKFPKAAAWHASLIARPSVEKVIKLIAENSH